MTRCADLVAKDTGIAQPGRLRPSVQVCFEPEHVRISFGPWATSLPRAWVDERPAVGMLLARQSNLRDGLASAAAPVAELLAAQGCFVPDEMPATAALADVRLLFEPIKLEWYASYYDHPLWDALRSGSATRNELVAWIIHNYHVSRAAGIVASRMAISHPRWRHFFENDALEEFWHCDAYYFIDAPDLRVPGRDVRAYVPLPASLAFEQLCLVTAQRDPLAHLLIAYFQESSIIFKTGSETFYDCVENAYALGPFFQTWRQHIQIDIDHGHADGLKSLFAADWQVSAGELASALRTAWTAFYFLLAALDDISDEANAQVVMRFPVDREHDRAPTGVVPPRALSRIEDMVSWFAQRRRLPLPDHLPATEVVALLRASAFRALSFSRSHDALMLAGGIARTLERYQSDDVTCRPWLTATGNFLAETAVDSRRWYAAVSFLVARFADSAPGALPDEVGRLLRKYEQRADLQCSPHELDQHATMLHQLDELVERCLSSSAVVPSALTEWMRR